MAEHQREPRLFASSGAPVAVGKRVGQGVRTPMGEVRFTASEDGREVATGQPERWRVGEEAWVDRWESADLELERLTCRLRPELPDGMRVDDCWGVVWRFFAHRAIATFTVDARLAVPVPGGCGDSGEHLLAVVFETDTWRLQIGTQDHDVLEDRAYAGTLPARWWHDREAEVGRLASLEKGPAAPYSAWTARWYESLPPARWEEAKAFLRALGYAILSPPPEVMFPIEIDEDGLKVSLPPLESGDRGELQFVVAWAARHDADYPDEDDVSTRFAVDWAAREILRQAGCT